MKLLKQFNPLTTTTSLIMSLSHQHQLVVFHWSLSDSKSLQVSCSVLMSIQADLNYAVICMVSIFLLISNFSRLFFFFSKPLEDHSKHTNYNWYHIHHHIPHPFSALRQDPSIYLSAFFYFHSVVNWDSKIHWMTRSFLVN